MHFKHRYLIELKNISFVCMWFNKTLSNIGNMLGLKCDLSVLSSKLSSVTAASEFRLGLAVCSCFHISSATRTMVYIPITTSTCTFSWPVPFGCMRYCINHEGQTTYTINCKSKRYYQIKRIHKSTDGGTLNPNDKATCDKSTVLISKIVFKWWLS